MHRERELTYKQLAREQRKHSDRTNSYYGVISTRRTPERAKDFKREKSEYESDRREKKNDTVDLMLKLKRMLHV